jgi:hypothetical protein
MHGNRTYCRVSVGPWAESRGIRAIRLAQVFDTRVGEIVLPLSPGNPPKRDDE